MVENKRPLGQGGGVIYYFIRYLWGSDVFHWFLLLLKVIDPPVSPQNRFSFS